MTKDDKDKNFSKVNINWFPGHMVKARKKIEENLKFVDVVAEIVDARIPRSSQNPEIETIISRKPRFIIFNKCDLADDVQTLIWKKYYSSLNVPVMVSDAIRGRCVSEFCRLSCDVLKNKIKKIKNRGIFRKNIRTMVIGIPNVGKSSLINNLIKKRKAKVENRPGVTRTEQWFVVDNGLELLDTPGVLWPRINDCVVSQNLAFTGAIKDEVIDYENIVFPLLSKIIEKYSDKLVSRYGVDVDDSNFDRLIEDIGRKRGMLMLGGVVDRNKVSKMIIDEFRSGKLGKITLERVDDVCGEG